MAEKTIVIKPQPGPQEAFLATSADIAFYGGAAGGGKSFALLLEPLRHLNNPEFGAMIFRRTTKQIRNEGGLWDEALKLYMPLGAEPKDSTLEVNFKTRMRVKFGHIEHEKNIYDHQGGQYPFIGFDEVTHFTEAQFFYLMSRNRSTSGVAGYIRGTMNPDANSWVRHFIDWWIGPDGLAIPERSGVIRWFIRLNEKIIWADTRQELLDEYGADVLPKSFTFISAKLEDNKILMEKDPSYKSNLEALPRVERMRLKDGNWNVQPSAGLYFRRSDFEIVDAVPPNCEAIRYWDRASTEVTDANKSKDPDYTVGLKMLKEPKSGIFYVTHVERFRHSPHKVEQKVLNTARQDGVACAIFIEQDPGSAGVADATNYMHLLEGFNVRANRPTTDKITRSLPVSAAAETGRIKLLRAPWNEEFLKEVENFPEDKHDDQVDTLSGAFNMHTEYNVGTMTDQHTEHEDEPMAQSLGAKQLW